MKARRWWWELSLGAEIVSRMSDQVRVVYKHYTRKDGNKGMAYLDDRAITSMER